MKSFVYRLYYSLIRYRKAQAFVYGHPIYKDSRGIWRYLEDDGLFNFNIPKPCPKCKQERPKSGHDPCIENLPNVEFACCGHGFVGKDYVTLKNNSRMSLKKYLKYQKTVNN